MVLGMDGGIHQTPRGEVSISLRHLGAGMTKELLDIEESGSSIDEGAGKAVTQIMHPDIAKANGLPCCVPAMIDRVEWFPVAGLGNIHGQVSASSPSSARRICLDCIITALAAGESRTRLGLPLLERGMVKRPCSKSIYSQRASRTSLLRQPVSRRRATMDPSILFCEVATAPRRREASSCVKNFSWRG